MDSRDVPNGWNSLENRSDLHREVSRAILSDAEKLDTWWIGGVDQFGDPCWVPGSDAGCSLFVVSCS